MKFLCIECDQAMKLKETMGPDEGSMTIVYRCPNCGKEMAMLTNPMETQVVGSLGVSIGASHEKPQPMGTLKKSLAGKREDVLGSRESNSGSGCPFSETVKEAFSKNGQPKVVWTNEAEQRLNRIPSFVRPMAKKGIEQYALENGYDEINDTVMDEVKDLYGM